MPAKKPLEADARIPLELFDSEKQLMAPLFQRRYVWQKQQLDQLWEDIDAILDGEDDARFLGAIVLVDKSSGKSFEPKSYWVIDGQQRVTTLYLMLLAIARTAIETGQSELAEDTVVTYLLNQKGSVVNQPKIRPTNRDLRQWSDVHNFLKPEFDPAPPQPFGDADGKMMDAFKSIRREVKARHDQIGNGYLKRLAEVILEQLKFVEIVLSSDENPNQVYDALNTKGEKLGIIDLVRNEVFKGLTEKPDKAQQIFNSEWSDFENALGDDASTYFFPFALIHNSSVTKSRIFQVLQNRWKGEGWSASEIITDLMTYVPTFAAIVRGKDLEVSAEIITAMDRLRRMPAPTVSYPFTMQVVYHALIGQLDEATAFKNLRLVESLLVRRALAGFEPTGLHAVFKTMWDKAEGSPAEFVKIVDANPTVDFPSDEQFRVDIQTNSLYGRKLANYVVTEYERGLKGGDPIPLDAKVETLDHLMPQTLSTEWSSLVDKEVHEKLVHTWANLVPLSQPFNSEKGQQTWDDIRERLETETIFKTPRLIAKANKKWNEKTIRQRAEELGDWAVSRWPK